jgi:bacteriorhodopsin
MATVNNNQDKQQFLFGKENYLWMAVGLVVIIIGYVLMSGGKSKDPNVFDEKEIYSFTRITLAPILVLLGLAIEGYAIMKRPSAKN